MNVFTNVSSQVSGFSSSLGSWFKKEGQEGQEGQGEAGQGQGQGQGGQSADLPPSPPSANASDQSVKGSADENEDAASQHSGATEGADSNPPSEAEEEQEAKTGFASAFGEIQQAWEGLGFNLSAVQGKASASAKSVGSFFSSAFSKAGASVKEAGSKIKESVEKNTLLSEFNKEQEAFIKAKGGKGGEALPPWVGYPDEEGLKEEILALATDRRNFVRNPPAGVNFEFDLESFLPVAQATLAADPNLEKMRFELVPKTIDEETFWRNYFYRVGLIRQSTELSSLEREGVEGAAKQPAGDSVKGKDEEEQGDTAQPDNEFVSDSLPRSSKQDVEEVRKGLSDLTKPSEEDWERELQEELGEYEVVGAGSEKDNEKWEAEIEDLIDDESDLR